MTESKKGRRDEPTLFLAARGEDEEVMRRKDEDDEIKRRLEIDGLDLSRLKAVADYRKTALADLAIQVQARTRKGETRSSYIDRLYQELPKDR